MGFRMFDFGSGGGPTPGGTVDGSKMHFGQVGVPSKGTPVQLTAVSTPLTSGVWFYPIEVSGSKKIYIGTTQSKPTDSTHFAYPAAMNFFVECSDLSDIWIDSSDNDHKLTYMAC